MSEKDVSKGTCILKTSLLLYSFLVQLIAYMLLL